MEKSEILAQTADRTERSKRLRWAVGVTAVLSVMGVATALAVAPASEAPVNVRTVVEKLGLSNIQAVSLGDASFLREERIQRSDTLGSILARLGIQDPEALAFIRNNADTQVIHRQLAPGKLVSARTSESGELLSLYFPLNGKDTVLVVEGANGRFVAEEKALRFETQTVMKTAQIHSSLFAATDTAGIPDSVATQMAEIFGGEIDFHRDLRKDDRFTVIYEMQYLNGQPARTGRILAAEFINNGKSYSAIHFDQSGKDAYYTADGRSLRKTFLRSPLEFSRVTSGFAMRFHPILQQWRAHKGVDYGAPSGTRVRAIGDGVVDFAGRQGGYGNLVIIKHSGQYASAYGHLQGFAAGIQKGARIGQGDILGYVGQTGWATGPHLHYEFRINNQQVNPLTLNLPTSLLLEPAQLARFKASTAPLAGQLEMLRNTKISAFD